MSSQHCLCSLSGRQHPLNNSSPGPCSAPTSTIEKQKTSSSWFPWRWQSRFGVNGLFQPTSLPPFPETLKTLTTSSASFLVITGSEKSTKSLSTPGWSWTAGVVHWCCGSRNWQIKSHLGNIWPVMWHRLHQLHACAFSVGDCLVRNDHTPKWMSKPNGKQSARLGSLVWLWGLYWTQGGPTTKQ